jgi:hypothetical protein
MLYSIKIKFEIKEIKIFNLRYSMNYQRYYNECFSRFLEIFSPLANIINRM